MERTKRGLIQHCLQYADAYEDYPFDDNWAVMRHRADKRAFAFIYEREGKIYINLKAEPAAAEFWQSVLAGVSPGYHMNKKHWITVDPMAEIKDEEIAMLVENSYRLTLKIAAPRKSLAKEQAADEKGDRGQGATHGGGALQSARSVKRKKDGESPIVLMDVDDTLLDFAAAERAALTATLKSFSVPPTEEILARYSVINAGFWKAMERGEIKKEELVVERFRQLFQEFSLPFAPNEAQARYENNLKENYPLIPGALALLDELKGCYDLYAASNGTREAQTNRLEKSGLRPYFQNVFLSEDMGATKPHALYFQNAFSRIPHFDKARTVLVGDSLTSDVGGAANAGIRSVWYNPHGKERGNAPVDVEVRSLAEIPAAIASIFGE